MVGGTAGYHPKQYSIPKFSVLIMLTFRKQSLGTKCTNCCFIVKVSKLTQTGKCSHKGLLKRSVYPKISMNEKRAVPKSFILKSEKRIITTAVKNEDTSDYNCV